MTQPTVLTIVLNYRTADMTLKAAEAGLREMEGIDGEMIIVDNDSQDGSYEILIREAEARGWTRNNRVRVLASGHNGGFGAGNNFGIRHGLSDGRAPDFVYLLNSDAFLDPGAIQRLVQFMAERPWAGFAGSHVRGEDDAYHTTHFRFPSIAGEFEQGIKLGVISRLLSNAIVSMPPSDTPVQTDWVAGASMMIRARVLDEVGLFDETYFLYFEETDLCLRAARAGWQTWFVPCSRTVHIGSVSTGMKDWRRAPTYWFDSRRHYFAKNHGRAYQVLATLARVAGGLVWRARCLVTRRPIEESDRFLRDLIGHEISASLPRNRPKPPAARSDAGRLQSLAKDSK